MTLLGSGTMSENYGGSLEAEILAKIDELGKRFSEIAKLKKNYTRSLIDWDTLIRFTLANMEVSELFTESEVNWFAELAGYVRKPEYLQLIP